MRLSLKIVPNFYIDMTPVRPETCLGESVSCIKNIELQTTQGIRPLADLFEISDTEPEQLIIDNSCDKLDCLGAAMSRGILRVRGDAGNYPAQNMSGGRLHIDGSCGHHAACAMSGGRLDVDGNASHFLGGALPGAMQGLHGGTVVVKGDAGNRLGDRMRRGFIIVAGSVGTHCASRMIAGTIVALNKVGGHLGFGMRRGSLLLHSRTTVETDYFTRGIQQEISILPLLIKHLHELDEAFKKITPTRYAKRCIGDLTVAGLGEILRLNLR